MCEASSRSQVASDIAGTGDFGPSRVSEITSLSPRTPHRARVHQNSVREVNCSGEGTLPLWISDPPSEFWDGCSDRAADPLVSRTNIPDQPPSRGDSINGTRRRPPSRSHSSTGRIGDSINRNGDSINSRRRLSASFSTYAGDSGNEANRESNKKPLIAGLIKSPATNGHLRSNLAHQWL